MDSIKYNEKSLLANWREKLKEGAFTDFPGWDFDQHVEFIEGIIWAQKKQDAETAKLSILNS